MLNRHMLPAIFIGALAPAEGSTACLDAAAGCRGLTFTAVYTGEPIRNVHGGNREGGTYLDNLDLQFAVDRGHFFGIPGLAAFAYMLHNNCGPVQREYVGDTPNGEQHRRAGGDAHL